MKTLQELIDKTTAAITISQPYATYIANGEKWVENRTWSTNHRGPIVIHAGKGTQYLTKKELEGWPNGCAIAVANLVACVEIEDVRKSMPRTIAELNGIGVSQFGLLAHDHAHGPWCWILSPVEPCVPFPYKGAQGIWGIRP